MLQVESSSVPACLHVRYKRTPIFRPAESLCVISAQALTSSARFTTSSSSFPSLVRLPASPPPSSAVRVRTQVPVRR